MIITSATLDIKKFADYFGAPMVKIPGKVFPVSLRYLPSQAFPPRRRGPSYRESGLVAPLWSRAKNTEAYIKTAIDKVMEVHRGDDKGDILVFLPGKEEVEQCCGLLLQNKDLKRNPNLRALPVYAALPFEAQCEIFSQAAPGVRKVVVATNIAETSITIDGIYFVIDMGFFKESTYDKGIDTLKVSESCD